LNIEYDVYSGESQVLPSSIAHANQVLEERKLVTEDKGALLVNLEKYKLAKPLIRKRDGTSLYLTRDIGAAKQRFDQYNFDKMVYVVASQQDLHLKQLFKVLELMGYDWAKRCTHVNFGMVHLPSPLFFFLPPSPPPPLVWTALILGSWDEYAKRECNQARRYS
jgi:arginyl-tRNA synthetase